MLRYQLHYIIVHISGCIFHWNEKTVSIVYRTIEYHQYITPSMLIIIISSNGGIHYHVNIDFCCEFIYNDVVC
jgi:hypothetical protein